MYKRVVILFLVLVCNIANAQELYTINCRVIDEITKMPISNVYVAINNTSRGTSTSQQGEFHFEITKKELGNNLYIACAGYVDTLIPCRRIIKNHTDEIVLRPIQFDLEQVDVVANFDKEVVFGDTAFIFSEKSTAIPKPYYMEYSTSIGCLFINKTYGILDRIIINLLNDGYHGGKFAIRLKKISPRKHYLIGWKMLNRYEDIIKKPIIIEAESPGVIDIDLSSFMAFVPERNHILLLIYPLENMEGYTSGYSGMYMVTSRVAGNTNAALYPYPTIRPGEMETVFLMNNECIVSKYITPPQIALIMKTYE